MTARDWMLPPAPGPLAGTDPLTRRTRLQLAWLSIRHMDTCTATVLLRILAATLLLYALICVVLGVTNIAEQTGVMAVVMLVGFLLVGFPVGQTITMARWSRNGGWVAGYFDATATMLVHPTSGTWVLSDHLATRRGRGLARPFRQRVFTHLAAAADRLKVIIVMYTISPTLADLYMRDLPGLEIVEHDATDWCGRRLFQLNRQPLSP